MASLIVGVLVLIGICVFSLAQAREHIRDGGGDLRSASAVFAVYIVSCYGVLGMILGLVYTLSTQSPQSPLLPRILWLIESVYFFF